MTEGATQMRVVGSDTATVRVFALDLPDADVEAFVTEADGDWPLQRALGAETLRADFVDTVRIEDLGEMALSRYLVEAHGVDAEDLADMRARLDALRGTVIVLPAQAFDYTTQELRIAAPLRWIGTFGEVRADAPGPRLTSASASGTGAKAPPSDAAMSGRIASLVLLFLFIFVGIFIWIAA